MTDATLAAYKPRLHPLKAMSAIIRFLRVKEDTSAFFRLTRALDAPSNERNFQRFRNSELGARVLAEGRDLYGVLCDRRALAALPDESLGRAYLDFVTREKLSPEAFQKELDAAGARYERAGEARKRFALRFAHMHDLYHVVTGYGRDFVGELGLFAFTRAQTGSLAILVGMVTGYFKGKRDYPGLPIGACIREGARLGRNAGDLICADWESLIAQPLAQVRRQLQIGVPRHYLAVQANAERLDQRYREELAYA